MQWTTTSRATRLGIGLSIAICACGCVKDRSPLPAGESTAGATIVLIDDAHLGVEINGKSLYTDTVMHFKLAELRVVFPSMDPAHKAEPFPKLAITGIWSNPSMEWPYVLAVDDELVRARLMP